MHSVLLLLPDITKVMKHGKYVKMMVYGDSMRNFKAYLSTWSKI